MWFLIHVGIEVIPWCPVDAITGGLRIKRDKLLHSKQKRHTYLLVRVSHSEGMPGAIHSWWRPYWIFCSKRRPPNIKESTLFHTVWSTRDIIMVLLSNVMFVGSMNLKSCPNGNHVSGWGIFSDLEVKPIKKIQISVICLVVNPHEIIIYVDAYYKGYHISMGYCKKDVTLLLTHWSYVFLALTHRYYWLLKPPHWIFKMVSHGMLQKMPPPTALFVAIFLLTSHIWTITKTWQNCFETIVKMRRASGHHDLLNRIKKW